MPRYQTESQRASGANSVSSGSPNGVVSSRRAHHDAGWASGPSTATATTATTHTNARLTTNAISASRNAASSRGRDIACRPMVVATFWSDHRNLITAVITLIAAFLLAQIVDRAIQAR